MSFSCLRFGQFCNFRPKVCVSASGSKRLTPFAEKQTFGRSRKTGQASGMKMTFNFFFNLTRLR
ncbi:hypothetical protein Hanom_Chr16g01512171 [Helianthus anomalus]